MKSFNLLPVIDILCATLIVHKLLAENVIFVSGKSENESIIDVPTAFEHLVNDSIGSYYIRNKLYSFLDNLAEKSQITLVKQGHKHLLTRLFSIELSKYKSRRARSCNFEKSKELERVNKDVLDLIDKEIDLLKKKNAIEWADRKEQSCETKCALECRKQECKRPNCPIIPEDTSVCSDPVACPKGCSAHWIERPTKNVGRKLRSFQIKPEERQQDHISPLSKGLVRFSEILNNEQKTHFNKTLSYLALDKLNEDKLIQMIELLDHFKEDITRLSNGILYDYPKIAKLYNSDPNKGSIITEGIMSILGNVIPSALTRDYIIGEYSKPLHERDQGYVSKDLARRIQRAFLRPFRGREEELSLFSNCDGKDCDDFCPEHKKVDRCSFRCSNNERCGQYECHCEKIRGLLKADGSIEAPL